jgi:Gpi18-like mannosyltransferase
MSSPDSIATRTAERLALTRLLWRLDTTAGIVALFAAGLCIRFLIAPRVGYYADLNFFQAWATRLDHVGLHRFYGQDWADYPPGYLYVLWMIGKISSQPGFVLLKVPAILGDLALAWIAGLFAARLAPAAVSERWPVRPLVAAAVLFNPAVLMVGVVWGQVDVVPAVFVLWALLLLFTGMHSFRRELSAFLLYGIAFSMKPQAGFVFPVMAYALYRHHLHRRVGAAWRAGIARIAAAIGVFLAFLFVSALPFGLGPAELIRFYNRSASIYPFTSSDAFNLWGVVGFWRRDSPGAGDYVALAGIPAVEIGLIIFAVGLVVILWRSHRRYELGGADPSLVLAVAAASTSLFAFAVLTRMHERYAFYALAFLAPVIFIRPLRLVYAALSVLYVLNLWWVYAYNNSRGDLGRTCSLPAPGCFGVDWIFGGFATDTWQKKVASAAVTVIAIALTWLGVSWTLLAGRARGVPALGETTPERRRGSASTASALGARSAGSRSADG